MGPDIEHDRRPAFHQPNLDPSAELTLTADGGITVIVRFGNDLLQRWGGVLTGDYETVEQALRRALRQVERLRDRVV